MVIELAVAVMIFSDGGNGRQRAMDTVQALSFPPPPPPPHGGNAEAMRGLRWRSSGSYITLPVSAERETLSALTGAAGEEGTSRSCQMNSDCVKAGHFDHNLWVQLSEEHF